MVNSVFSDDRCYATGPDLGGGAIRATGMDMSIPVYIVSDTFTGNSCSNGAALSGLFANFAVYNSLMTATRRSARAPTRPSQGPRAAAAVARFTPTAPVTTCWWAAPR